MAGKPTTLSAMKKAQFGDAAMAHVQRQLQELGERGTLLLRSRTRVMRALSTGDEARAFWRALREGESESVVNKAVDRTRAALEQMEREISRPTETNELADIQSVIDLAGKLKTAIVTSSLPKNTAWSDRFQLSAVERPDVEVDIGWHGLNPNVDWLGYPLAVTDVLDAAIKLAQLHLDGLPARSLVRRSGDAELRAFVRHLAWQFDREFGNQKMTAVAHATTAIFECDPLDRTNIEKLLEDRTQPFQPSR